MTPNPHLLLLACLALLTPAAPAQHVLLEAEQFADTGGWDVDQQSMDQMGSPYLLAHGLGVPVRDAVTRAEFPSPGRYRVWVRTRDWVAPWKAPGAPGRFKLLVDGKPLAETFGTEGEAWHWQDGGSVDVGVEATVALHDLTGFEGRCDAVLFSKDAAFVPPNELAALTKFRRSALGLPEEPEDGGSFDLVVVGGGIAGTSAALSAGRNGLKVALVQDRPVLGGNGSSEVRVWPEGKTRQEPFPHIGDIVEELVPDKGSGDGNAKGGPTYADERKLDLVRAEPRITLLTEEHVNAVVVREGRIQSVVAQHVRTARRVRLSARLFADCTGDGTLGFLAGADYEVSKEGVMGASNLWNLTDVSDPAQVLLCECKDKEALSLSVRAGSVVAPFPRCPWAMDLTDRPFPGRRGFKGQWAGAPLDNLGGWFWESGFDKDQINDKGIYWAPYRCLYSRNVANLFKAGRDISVDHEALGPVRVMRTCGMMGEVVGKAAWICVSQQTTPRGVYEGHLALLKELMSQPGALRRAALGGPLAP